jgi:hypothetical protein
MFNYLIYKYRYKGNLLLFRKLKGFIRQISILSYRGWLIETNGYKHRAYKSIKLFKILNIKKYLGYLSIRNKGIPIPEYSWLASKIEVKDLDLLYNYIDEFMEREARQKAKWQTTGYYKINA